MNETKLKILTNKIDELSKNIKILLKYILEHHAKIAVLEERTKKL